MEDVPEQARSVWKPTLQDYIDRLGEHYSAHPSKGSRWYARIVTDCNRFLPGELRRTPVESITPQMLQEAINRVCRLGGKRYQSIVSGMRDCFRLASLDDAITTNPALHVHIRELNSTTNPIDDELYGEILRQVRVVPGGYVFGLSGFADTTMLGISNVRVEECDMQRHAILVRRANKQKTARIADPDGIALMDDAYRHYETRMEDEAYALNNDAHLLCANRFGMPYEPKQLSTICELLRDACNNPNVDVTAFRRFIRYRQL